MRYDLYDLFLEKPEPLVPRQRRIAVQERLNAAGDVLLPLAEQEVREAARSLKAQGVEAVAVCLLHSYLDPAHERRAGAILAEELPGVPITLSSDVAPEIREYERANTACVNAYVMPLMDRYLQRLEAELQTRGLRGKLHLMLSAGGIATVRHARANPVQLIESGPAAGAMAAMHVGRAAGLSEMISFDMGGTTAKMCLHLRSRASEALPKGVGPAAEGAGDRPDRDRRGRRFHRAGLRDGAADGRPRKRGRRTRAGLLWPWRHAADSHRCRPAARLPLARLLPGRGDGPRPRDDGRRDGCASRQAARPYAA
jgi:hypothetical protein